MSETKVQPTHLRRAAVVYVRQSTVAQVEQNRESTRRQYDLAERARQFGWRTDQITVLDEDLGLSAATTRGRGGFARMTAQVALGHVGILLGLEVSRLARNNADWYRLLDLCGITDTLIGDADGVYDPNVFNDRLILGLKGTRHRNGVLLEHARKAGMEEENSNLDGWPATTRTVGSRIRCFARRCGHPGWLGGAAWRAASPTL